MNVNQLPILGAEIRGLDLSGDLTNSESVEIKNLLTENLVLIIKDQNLSPKNLVKISSLWGGAFEHPVFKGLEETPEVLQIENMGEQFHTNAHWHSDVTFEQKPPNVTLLYAIEVPEEGGNTLFSNQYLAYEDLDEAIKNDFDQVLIDTAGRLQNKKNLMEEYKKIANVTKKIDPNAPHNVILVLDATSGQNVLNQVEEFNKIIPITGIVMTKLDGTAKGGILLALAKKYKLPIIALGLGEKEDDLQIFEAEKFAEAFTQIN